MMMPMNTFFCVKETIPPGVGFSLFSAGHLIWLASTVLVTVMTALLYRKSGDKTRFIIRLVISLLLLADEAVKQILLFATGQFGWDYLPLHLCSINIFIVLIHVITGSRYVAEALFALCLPAAAAALCGASFLFMDDAAALQPHGDPQLHGARTAFHVSGSAACRRIEA